MSMEDRKYWEVRPGSALRADFDRWVAESNEKRRAAMAWAKSMGCDSLYGRENQIDGLSVIGLPCTTPIPEGWRQLPRDRKHMVPRRSTAKGREIAEAMSKLGYGGWNSHGLRAHCTGFRMHFPTFHLWGDRLILSAHFGAKGEPPDSDPISLAEVAAWHESERAKTAANATAESNV
jgi:hypothetical protein